MSVCERTGMRTQRAQVFDAIGIIYEERNNLRCALQAYQAELALLEEANDPVGMQLTYMTLSRVYQRIGWDHMAEPLGCMAPPLASHRNAQQV